MAFDPSYPREARALLRLGVPLAGSMVAQFLIVSTDTLMLGWYGVPELAAVTLAGGYFHIFFVLVAGFAFALMPLAASAHERGDIQALRRVTRMSLWLCVGVAAVMQVPFWVSEGALLALGQDTEVASLAAKYLFYLGPSLFPAMIVQVLRSYLSALERTGIILGTTIIAVVANAVCNYLLIFGNFGFPELGIVGAAVASLFNNLVMVVILVIYALRHFPEHDLFGRLWRPDWAAMRDVYRLGWPIGITHVFETAFFSASAIMVGWIGTFELAAHGVALQLAALTFMAHLGLSQAATVRVGQAMGRSEPLGVRLTGQVGVLMSVGFSILTIAVFLSVPEPLLGVFLEPEDPDRDAIIAIGIGLLAVAALFQMVDGAQVLALSLLRGLEDTRVPMVLAAISYWVVGTPAGYLFGFVIGIGAVGVWLGLVVGLSVASALIMWRFWVIKAPWKANAGIAPT